MVSISAFSGLLFGAFHVAFQINHDFTVLTKIIPEKQTN